MFVMGATAGRGVAVVVQVFGFGGFAVFAAVAFEQRASGERIAGQIERLKQQYPQVAFALGTHFGFEPGIFAILDRRADEDELAGDSLLECDGCKYREAAEEEHLHDHSHTATGGCGHAHAHHHADHPNDCPNDHLHDHSHCQHAKS